MWQVCRFDEQEVVDRVGPTKVLPDAAAACWTSIPVPGNKFEVKPQLRFCHRMVYRTRVNVPAGLAGRSFFLRFPSLSLIASVHVNGQPVGTWFRGVASLEPYMPRSRSLFSPLTLPITVQNDDPHLRGTPPETITLEQVETVLRNLVIGRFCACQEAGRRMLAAGRGSIINIGSLASVSALGRGHIAYSMAMGAVAQMTRELSTEWSGQGVRVNAILPAQVVNPGLEARMAADPHLRTTYLRGIPAGRLGEPDDIRGLAVFLASDASRWITGALIPMDGGNLALNGGGTVRPPRK